MSSAAAQRTAVADFVATTNCTSAQAKKYLQASAWNMNNAVNAFFESGDTPQGAAPVAPKSGADVKAIEAEFVRLAGGDPAAETLTTDGLLNLATELDVDLENL